MTCALPIVAVFVIGSGVAPAPEQTVAEPEPTTMVVMAPDRPEDDLDERALGAIEAHAADTFELKVVRYPEEHFEVTDLDRRSSRVAGEFAAAGVIWLDLDQTDRFTIYLYEPQQERLSRRHVPRTVTADAAAIEALANIAGSILAESLLGPVQGMTEIDPEELRPAEAEPAAAAEPEPQPAPRPAPVEPAPLPPPRWPRLWIAAAYGGNTFADALPWTHAVVVAVAWTPVLVRERGLPLLGLRYDVAIPATVAASGVELELRRHPITLFAGYRHRVGARVDVEVQARVGIDPIVRHGRDEDDTDGTRVDGGSSLRVFSSAGASIGIGWSPLPWLRLFSTVGAEAALTRADYVVQMPARTVVIAPHPARLVLDAGVQFALIRRPRRASHNTEHRAKND